MRRCIVTVIRQSLSYHLLVKLPVSRLHLEHWYDGPSEIVLNCTSLENNSASYFWQFLSPKRRRTIWSRLVQGCTDFPLIEKLPPNSRYQKGDMKQIPTWGITNIRRHPTKFTCHGRPDSQDLCTPGLIFSPLCLELRIHRVTKCFGVIIVIMITIIVISKYICRISDSLFLLGICGEL